jgi:hypothetical protein
MSEKVTLSEDQWTDAIRKHYVSLGDDEGQGVHPYYKAAFKDGVNFARALLASSPECGSGDADKRVARDESLRGEVAYQLQVRNRWLDMPTMRSIVDSAFNAAIATTIATIAAPAPAEPKGDPLSLTEEQARVQDYAEQNMLTYEEAADELRAAEPKGEQQAALSDDDMALFAQTDHEFEDCGETTTSYEKLLEWVSRGLLRCTHFEVTPDGNALLSTLNGGKHE